MGTRTNLAYHTGHEFRRQPSYVRVCRFPVINPYLLNRINNFAGSAICMVFIRKELLQQGFGKTVMSKFGCLGGQVKEPRSTENTVSW